MPSPAPCRPPSTPKPTQRLRHGTRSGLGPSLRPRTQGAAGDPLPTPGSSPSVPAQKRTPRSARVPLARSPRPLGRPVTLTGGLPGSGLRPVTRPRPPRRERLPRAGTGSRAGQVGVSAAPTHPGPPDPVRPGRTQSPPGAGAGAAAPPEGHLQALPGTRDPDPTAGSPGNPRRRRPGLGAGGGRTRRGAHTRRGRGTGTCGRPACPRPSRDPGPLRPPARRTWLTVGARTRGDRHEGAETDTRARTRGHGHAGGPGAHSGPGSCPARRRARGSPCRAGVGRRDVRGAVTWAAARLPQRACARVFAPSAPSSSSSSSRRAARAWLRGDGLRVRVCVRAPSGDGDRGTGAGLRRCARGGEEPVRCARVRTRTGAGDACTCAHTEDRGPGCVCICAHRGQRVCTLVRTWETDVCTRVCVHL